MRIYRKDVNCKFVVVRKGSSWDSVTQSNNSQDEASQEEFTPYEMNTKAMRVERLNVCAMAGFRKGYG